MKSVFLCTIGVLSVVFLVSSLLGEEPSELTKLLQGYEVETGALQVKIKSLDESYLAALERLEKTKTSQGNLEVVLAVRDEIAAHEQGYEPERFDKRISEIAELKKLQTTYRNARAKTDAEIAASTAKLAARYHEKMAAMVKELTKAGRIDEALAVTKEKDRLASIVKATAEAKSEKTAPMGAAEKKIFRARAYCTAKGQAEIYLNGKEIHLRLTNPDDDRGTDGKSPFFDLSAGDVVTVKTRGHAVYRSLALAFDLPDEDRVLFFQSGDFKIMGNGPDIDPEKIDAKAIESAPNVHPQATVPDQDWVNIWAKHRLGGGGFLKPEPQGQWVVWSGIVTEVMLERGR